MFIPILTLFLALLWPGLEASTLKMVCYFTNDLHVATTDAQLLPEDVDVHLCSHIIYVLGDIRNGTLTGDQPSDVGAKGLFRRTTALKKKRASLRISLMVGNTVESLFDAEGTLDAFVKNAAIFLRSYDFDGLDLDWEFPEDKYRLATLVEKLRTEFEAESLKSGKERLLVTVAVGCWANYDLKSLAKNVDFISLMAYDLYSGWEAKTDGQTNLYPGKGMNETTNGDWCVQRYIKQGFPPSKMVFGMGFYGRGFTLADPSQHGMGAPVLGPNKPGNFTRSKGILSSYEVCFDNWTEVFDPYRKIMYAYKGDQWISYENEKTIAIKAKYIIDKGLAGGMIWKLDLDDFRGKFCGKGKFPLLKAIGRVFDAGQKGGKFRSRIGRENDNSIVIL